MDNEQQQPNIFVEISKESKQKIEERQESGYFKDKIVENIVHDVCKSRVEKLTKVYEKRKETQNEINKIKKNPDQKELKDLEGNITVAAGFSAESMKKFKELSARVKKIDEALNEALLKGDYGKLEKFAN